ncbi:4Fe-4S dicluster domain-containing protein [Chloroflexota bacterium]
MPKMIAVDAPKCTGCRICMMVCALKLEGVVNPTMSRIQVFQHEHAFLEVPVVCQQCESPPCGAVCPVNAISWDENLGRTVVDQDLCVGCKMCVVVCPFGAMGFDKTAHKVINCDLCDGDPECVKFCDTKAIVYTEAPSVSLKKGRASSDKVAEQVRQLG